MATAINRTTYEYFAGVSDTLPTGLWIIDPDLTGISGVEQKYWKVEGDTVLEMTDTEKNIKDMHLASLSAAPAPDVVVMSGIVQADINNIPYVRASKPDADIFGRIYAFSVNTCDPTTWYVDSAYESYVSCPSAVGVSGLPITPILGQSFITPRGVQTGDTIIDLSHGKVTEENLLVAPTGSYIPEIFVDGVKMTERESYESSGGDYKIYYETGLIHFFESQSGKAINANYYCAESGAGPIFSVQPPPGKQWIIDAAELQVSDDFELKDTIVQNVFLTHPIYGRIPAIADVEYKHFSNFLDFTWGSHPIIPALGSGDRMMSRDTIIMRWEYLTPLVLKSSLEMELRSWSKHGRGHGGERFTLAVYGLESDE